MYHIVHVTTVHRPFDTRIFQKECRTLAQQGYRVSLIAAHDRHEERAGVALIPLPHHTSRFARMTVGIWNACRLAWQLEADLYHFHDPELLPVGIALKLTTTACVIYDVHENHSRKVKAREWLPTPLKGAASRLISGLERIAARLVDGIVAATDQIAAQFPAGKTIVAKNYPWLASLQPAVPEKREDRMLIYTGGLSNHRGIQQIVEALPHVKTPQVRLLLLGRVVDRQAKETVTHLPGFAFVDFVGQVPYAQVYRYLAQATIGLVCNQPRHDYALAQPNKLFEYMSAGLPVIASNFALWKKVVEGNQCGLTVDPTSPTEIAQAIDYLLARPELRRRMGENGRKAVQNQYNWDQESEKLLALYRRILGKC